jgi:cell wall-associated NlpC family hydrolase
MMPFTRQDVIDRAREMLGTPFHHQGRVPGIGVDCAGLLKVTFSKLGRRVVDRTDYERNPDGETLMSTLLANDLVRISQKDEKPADVVVFWINRHTKAPQHVAFKTDRGLLHCVCEEPKTKHPGKVVETSFDDRWRRRVVATLRLREFL